MWPTLGATWIAFAQVVSFQGLVLWVISGSLLGGVVVGTLAHHGRRVLALAAMVALPVVVAGLSEVLGGSTAGPITRSSLMATAAAGAMGLLVKSRNPYLMVLPSLMLLGGALGLGAAKDVLWLGGMWAVAAAATLAMLGPFRKEHLRARERLAPFALLLMGLGFAAIVATVAFSFLLRDPWTIPGAGVDSAVSEPSLSSPESPTPIKPEDSGDSSETSSSLVDPTANEQSVQEADVESGQESVQESVVTSLLRLIVLLVILLLLLAVLAVVIWRLSVGLRWWLVKRRLRRGSAAEQVLGAWTWLRLQRARRDAPLPAYVSADVAVAWARDAGDVDLLAVAQVAGEVAYDPGRQVSQEQAQACWRAARRGALAGQSNRLARIRTGFRTPRDPKFGDKTRTNLTGVPT